MRAIDVMARDVVTAASEMTVRDVARLMINRRISGIPVVNSDRQLLGIVTEGDLLRRVETSTERQRSRWSEWFSPNSRLAAEYVKSHARRVADVMSRDVVSVAELANSWRNSRSDGNETHQARAGPARWQAGRDRQPC